jgi:uncharacterized protein YqiB (DUF1249 family)
MTVQLAEETSANIKIKVTYKVMEASSLSLTKRNIRTYEDACHTENTYTKYRWGESLDRP